VSEVIEKSGADPEQLRVPDDVLAWGASSRLPSTRSDARSVWE
jgi:hypothetical protein